MGEDQRATHLHNMENQTELNEDSPSRKNKINKKIEVFCKLKMNKMKLLQSAEREMKNASHNETHRVQRTQNQREKCARFSDHSKKMELNETRSFHVNIPVRVFQAAVIPFNLKTVSRSPMEILEKKRSMAKDKERSTNLDSRTESETSLEKYDRTFKSRTGCSDSTRIFSFPSSSSQCKEDAGNRAKAELEEEIRNRLNILEQIGNLKKELSENEEGSMSLKNKIQRKNDLLLQSTSSLTNEHPFDSMTGSNVPPQLFQPGVKYNNHLLSSPGSVNKGCFNPRPSSVNGYCRGQRQASRSPVSYVFPDPKRQFICDPRLGSPPAASNSSSSNKMYCESTESRSSNEIMLRETGAVSQPRDASQKVKAMDILLKEVVHLQQEQNHLWNEVEALKNQIGGDENVLLKLSADESELLNSKVYANFTGVELTESESDHPTDCAATKLTTSSKACQNNCAGVRLKVNDNYSKMCKFQHSISSLQNDNDIEATELMEETVTPSSVRVDVNTNEVRKMPKTSINPIFYRVFDIEQHNPNLFTTDESKSASEEVEVDYTVPKLIQGPCMTFTNLFDLSGQMEEFCQGKNGSRFIIERLKNGREPERSYAFSELKLPRNFHKLLDNEHCRSVMIALMDVDNDARKALLIHVQHHAAQYRQDDLFNLFMEEFKGYQKDENEELQETFEEMSKVFDTAQKTEGPELKETTDPMEVVENHEEEDSEDELS